MQPQELTNQLLRKGLYEGFYVKLLLVDDFTIALVTDDNQVVDTYLCKDGKIVPFPLKDVLDEYWQQHSPTAGINPSELPDYELKKAKGFVLYCLERQNPIPVEDLHNKFVCEGISSALIQSAIKALQDERKVYRYATIKNPDQTMIRLNYKKG